MSNGAAFQNPSPLFAGGTKFDPNLNNFQDTMLGLGSGFLLGPNGGLIGSLSKNPTPPPAPGTGGGMFSTGDPTTDRIGQLLSFGMVLPPDNPVTPVTPTPVDTSLHQGGGTGFSETNYGDMLKSLTPTDTVGSTSNSTDASSSAPSLFAAPGGSNATGLHALAAQIAQNKQSNQGPTGTNQVF